MIDGPRANRAEDVRGRAAQPGRVTAHPPLEFRDGSVFSSLYGDVFKSDRGAFDEARTVFVDGCRVRERWARRADFTVLEIGFGLGVNFLATLAAWFDDPDRCARLHFVAIERHPVSQADLRRALTVLGAPAPWAEALCAQWPHALPGFARLQFAAGAVTLQLCLGSAEAVVPQLALRADAIYLDGFAPSRNPDAWTDRLFKAIGRLARRGARASTYSSVASVRRDLAAAGFEVMIRPGHAGKRRRIEAVFAPRWNVAPAYDDEGSAAHPAVDTAGDHDHRAALGLGDRRAAPRDGDRRRPGRMRGCRGALRTRLAGRADRRGRPSRRAGQWLGTIGVQRTPASVA